MALWSSAVKISWKKSCSIVRQYMIHLNTINLHVINTPTTWQQLLTRKPYLKLKWRVFSMGFMKTCWQYDSHLDWEALSLKTGVNKKKVLFININTTNVNLCTFIIPMWPGDSGQILKWKFDLILNIDLICLKLLKCTRI